MTQTRSIEEILARKKPNVKTLWLVLDPEAADAYNEVNARYEQLRERADLFPEDKSIKKQIADLLPELDAARKEAESGSQKFVFEAIGDEALDALRNEYPATPEQIRDADLKGEEKPKFDSDAFGVALLAASCVEPRMTIEDVQKLLDSEHMNFEETMALTLAAQEVNYTRRYLELGKGSGTTPNSAPSSRTASRKASRIRSS